MSEDTPRKNMNIPGNRLVPDLSIPKRELALTRYWYGLLPDCPVDPIQVGHVTFAKVMEIVTDGPGGETIRNPMIGCCSELQRDHVQQVANTLRRLIIRFQTRIIGGNDGMVEDTEKVEQEVIRVGHLIRIPTDGEIEISKERRTYRPYIPAADDKPAADYLFMVRQEQRGTEYPAPLSETGLEMPKE